MIKAETKVPGFLPRNRELHLQRKREKKAMNFCFE